MTPHATLHWIAPQRGWRTLWCALVCLTLVLPWISPLSSGPSPNTVPLLLSALCMLVLLLGYGALGQHVGVPGTRTAVFTAWLLAALLASAMGLAQYFGLADSLYPWVNHANMGEAYANLRQRNQFASLTSIGLAALLFFAAQSSATPHGGQHTGRMRTALALLALLALMVPLAMANAVSSSRTGALQWLMVAAMAGMWSRPGQRRSVLLALAALLVYALAVVALPAALGALTGVGNTGLLGRLEEPPSCESRRILWANVAELIAQKPWLGWGWGELKFAHFTHPYSGDRFCAILDNAHNLPLHLAVELGVPLATALCTVLAWRVWCSKPWRETDPARQMAWAVLAIIGLHSLVEYPLWYGPFQMAVCLCLWVLYRPAIPPGTVGRGGVSLAVLVSLPALLLLGYAAWDYMRISQLYVPQEQRMALFRVDTLGHARASRLFAREVQFADITTAPLTQETAQRHYTVANQLLHFSPEPRVLQALLESAQLLGLDDEHTRHNRTRFQAAYPDAFAKWDNQP